MLQLRRCESQMFGCADVSLVWFCWQEAVLCEIHRTVHAGEVGPASVVKEVCSSTITWDISRWVVESYVKWLALGVQLGGTASKTNWWSRVLTIETTTGRQEEPSKTLVCICCLSEAQTSKHPDDPKSQMDINDPETWASISTHLISFWGDFLVNLSCFVSKPLV